MEEEVGDHRYGEWVGHQQDSLHQVVADLEQAEGIFVNHQHWVDQLQWSLPRVRRPERAKLGESPLGKLAGRVQHFWKVLCLPLHFRCESPGRVFSLPLWGALPSGFVSRAGPTQKTTGLSTQLHGEVPKVLREMSQLWIKRQRPGTRIPWMEVS